MKIIDRFFIFVLVSILFTVLAISIISLVSSQVEIGAGEQSGVLLGDDDDDDGGGGGNVTEAEVEALINSLAWRLDGTNDPPSASWNMGSFDFNDVGSVVFDAFGSPEITSSASTIRMLSTIINMEADTINHGISIGDVSTSYKGTTTGVMVWNGHPNDRFFDFQAGMNIDDNLTILDSIEINNSFGSQDDVIDIKDFNNFSWDNAKGGCMIWEDSLPAQELRICPINPGTGVMEIFANILNLRMQTYNVGDNCLGCGTTFMNFITNNINGSLAYDGTDTWWEFEDNIVIDTGFLTRPSIFFSSNTVFKNNNLSWDGLIPANFIWTIPDLIMDIPYVNFTGSINASNGKICDSVGCIGDTTGGGDFDNNESYYARLNDLLVTGTSYQTDEWLSHHIEAGKNYTFEISIIGDIGTQGDGFNFNVTSDRSNKSYGWQFIQNAGRDGEVCNECSDEETPALENSLDFVLAIEGLVFPVQDSTLTIEFRKTVDTGADITIFKGSKMQVREVTI